MLVLNSKLKTTNNFRRHHNKTNNLHSALDWAN